MNVVVLSGRLTKPVNLAENGKTATFPLAVKRPFPFGKDKDGNEVTDFLTMKIIGEDRSRRASQYLDTGVKIDVKGVVCRDSWKDNNGEWKEFNYILVDAWEYAESKAASQQNGGGNSQSQPQPSPQNDDFMQIDDSMDDSGIPFH